jgi:hypothetical protein
MDYSEEDMNLLLAIAEGHSFKTTSVCKDRARLMYKPLYKHPLDSMNESRYRHEELLKRIFTRFDVQLSTELDLIDVLFVET